MHTQCFIVICMIKIMDQSSIHQRQFSNVLKPVQKQHVYTQYVARNCIRCIIKQWSTSTSTYCSTYIFIGRPQLVVYPPCITCVSTYCTTYIFIGRPRFVVYPPRIICCHILLYVCYWVDHNLWSTPRALCCHIYLYVCY